MIADAKSARHRWLALGLALACAAAAFVAVAAAQKTQGIARDEVVYMRAGSHYARWWQAWLRGDDGIATRAGIGKHFGGPRATDNNREHPPLMKLLFGVSANTFHSQLGWTDRITAYRLPSAAMNAVLIALVVLFVAGRWGPIAGVIAGLLTLSLPRAFFHAGLACFDAAVVTTWFAVLYTYDRALASARWSVALGLCFGLALATKHNALMLPAVLGPHYLWLSWRRSGDAVGPDAGRLRARLGAWVRAMWQLRPSAALMPIVLGPLVLIALWPWLWFDTVEHVGDWIGFHLRHVHYNYEYLGRNWNAPPYPFHVPLVTTLFTVPVATLAAAAIGVGISVARVIQRRAGGGGMDGAASEYAAHGSNARAPLLLLTLSLIVAIGPFLLGWAPIFGAEKHWAPAIPTLCILAAIGVAYAAEQLVRAWRLVRVGHGETGAGQGRIATRTATAVMTVVLGAIVVAAAAIETVAAHPYALSHYNALAGGAAGGADAGMNRQFWGVAARGVLGKLDEVAAAEPVASANAKPRPTLVYTHDASPAWGMYQRHGLVGAHLPDAGHERGGVQRSRIAIVIHERHFARHDYMIWDVYGMVQPAFVLTFQGVPLVSVYVRPR